MIALQNLYYVRGGGGEGSFDLAVAQGRRGGALRDFLALLLVATVPDTTNYCVVVDLSFLLSSSWSRPRLPSSGSVTILSCLVGVSVGFMAGACI